jgi:hypothetical protein
VVAPANVFAKKGDAIASLAPGTVALVTSEQGWLLVAKEGKLLAYVTQASLAPIQWLPSRRRPPHVAEVEERRPKPTSPVY